MIRVDGNATVDAGERGQGLIVVTGDLTLTTGFSWRGVILVGRRLLVINRPSVERRGGAPGST